MKFRFKLDKLLRTRSMEKDVARRGFLEAKSAYLGATETLREIYESITESREMTERVQNREKSSGHELILIHNYIEGQAVKAQRQRVRIQELNEVVEEKLDVLVNAARQFKIIEKLKEKRKAEFKKEMAKRDRKEVDEIVVMYTKRGETNEG